ncbi:LPXTG cell wall anchor domain-containing protein [Streptomyces sp. NPDC049915]|uniref:LPXTG cell wall anchor domain-containing protein n=1 Tax=Streptomyces sp. NPDC049915 TaxID=3155510 RepID=UPI00342C3825
MRLFPLAPVPAAAAATLLPLLPLPALAAPAAHVLTAPAHTGPAPAHPANAAPAPVVPAYAAPAYAALAPDPACAADTGSSDFPLRARIRGGPAAYDAGGGYGVWYLDLTNTTHGTCTAVHPVVVLVDERRALTAAQPRLEFDDGARTRSVRFETTDEDELVGAFGETDGFGGFSVGPRRTLTVRVRLAFTADAVPNEVTAEAAVVRRHDDDGDWVGQSNDYRFAVRSPSGPAPQQDPATDPGATPPGPARTPATARPTPDPTPAPTGALATDELARTGIADGALAAAVALLLGGAALLVLRRRR